MRTFLLRAIFCLIVALGLIGCGKPVSGSAGGGPIATANAASGAGAVEKSVPYLSHAQPKLETVKVWLGSAELIAEIARTEVQICTGMMYRTNMAENEAMIFIFPYPDQKSFYMRNCVVPLSAAYIRPDGTIDEIIDLQPREETPVVSKSSNLQFVLEVPQGWFQRHNVKSGMLIRTESGSLQETFFRR